MKNHLCAGGGGFLMFSDVLRRRQGEAAPRDAAKRLEGSAFPF
jgi:hypothetical protein